ncbi:MAG: NAD(P)-binding domain-containing protein [Candidatus Paceibacterota bacterium]|jgi:homoserine dehydrogenase
MKMRVGIIGTGKIARHLISRLKDMGIETCFSINRSNSSSLERLLLKERPEAVFLTISTLDKGEAAREYILQCVKNNVPVITCEKGAFAYHASALQPYFNKIGAVQV